MIVTTAPLQPVRAVIHIHIKCHRALLRHCSSYTAKEQGYIKKMYSREGGKLGKRKTKQDKLLEMNLSSHSSPNVFELQNSPRMLPM